MTPEQIMELKAIRKELIDAHLEYDKRLAIIWEHLNKLIGSGIV